MFLLIRGKLSIEHTSKGEVFMNRKMLKWIVSFSLMAILLTGCNTKKQEPPPPSLNNGVNENRNMNDVDKDKFNKSNNKQMNTDKNFKNVNDINENDNEYNKDLKNEDYKKKK